MRSATSAAALLASLLAAAVPAHAVDGVIEISQSKAVAGTVISGDAAGFPVTIPQNGSYRLTSNLTVDENTTAITVQTGVKDVTIDLNGFSITGPVTCTGSPVSSCSPAGLGSGIFSNYAGTRLRVYNGHVRGMGRNGVVIARGEVDHVHAAHNGTWGISAVEGGVIVHDSISESNGSGGIGVPTASVVRDCVANGNGLIGISAKGSLVQGNVSRSNVHGIDAQTGSTLLDNDVRYNSYGIHVAANAGAVAYGRNMLHSNGTNVYLDPGAVAIQVGPNICTNDVCP